MKSITISIVLSDILKNYLIFQQDAEDSVLSGKLSEKAKLTELKSQNSKAENKVRRAYSMVENWKVNINLI